MHQGYNLHTMQNKKTIFTLITALLVIVLLSSFLFISNNDNEDKKNNEEITVSATIFPLYDITKNIVGDKIEVNLILPSGASPHTFSPNIEDKQKINDSQAVFVIGLELDSWIKEIVDDDSDNTVVEVYEDIDLLEFGGNKEEHEDESHNEDGKESEDMHEEEGEANDEKHGEEEDSHEHGDFDPHYWLSIENAKVISQNIYDKVVTLDTENEDYYKENLEEYILELENTKKDLESKLSSIDTRELITFHDAFEYFAKENDLEIVGTIETSPGKDPSAEQMQKIGDLIEEHDIKALFKEPQMSEEVIKSVAEDYNVKIGTLDPLGGVEERNTYINLIKYNVESVYRNLNE